MINKKRQSAPLVRFKRLTEKDVALLRQLNEVFADAFADPATYRRKPRDSYVKRLLSKTHIIVLVAIREKKVVGGLVAYLLEKFEQSRSEAYLYDLAVSVPHRRQGIARELISRLKTIARKSGAWVIFVQADRPDTPAIKLYQSLGQKEEPLHFDIPIE